MIDDKVLVIYTTKKLPDEIQIKRNKESEPEIYVKKKTCKKVFIPYIYDDSIGHTRCSECRSIILSPLDKYCRTCGSEIQGDFDDGTTSNS